MSRWVLTLEKRIEMDRGSRYLLLCWPTVSVLHKFLDTKKDIKEGISMRMVNDSAKLWIDALSFKQLRHGNATAMQQCIF